jgi:hypothetical protein
MIGDTHAEPLNAGRRSTLTPVFTYPPCLAFIVTRSLLMIACYLCLEFFPAHTLLSWQAHAFSGNNWLDGWVRWDSMWYESLVDSGAQWLPPEHSGANFFPFYAWTAWIASLPLRPFLRMEPAFYVGALVLSHASFLLGLIGVYRMAIVRVGHQAAARAVWLMAFFPFSFFFSAVYADALYFCLAAWCFTWAQSTRWRLSSTCAAAAAVTRLPGFALFPSLLADYLAQHDFRLRSLRRETGAGLILAAAALVVVGYFWVRYGSPVAFVYARQTGWHRATGFAALVTDIHDYTAGSLLACNNVKDCLRGWDMTRKLLGYWYLGLVPISLMLTWSAARVLGIGQCIWVLTSMAMALMNGLDGMGRFTAVLFPVFIAAGLVVRSRAQLIAVCAGFTPFLLLFMSQFARWRPVL